LSGLFGDTVKGISAVGTSGADEVIVSAVKDTIESAHSNSSSGSGAFNGGSSNLHGISSVSSVTGNFVANGESISLPVSSGVVVLRDKRRNETVGAGSDFLSH
jgi:hypothetical protein